LVLIWTLSTWNRFQTSFVLVWTLSTWNGLQSSGSASDLLRQIKLFEYNKSRKNRRKKLLALQINFI
jgi:hypothetical protein